jgi:hypothetical protein
MESKRALDQEDSEQVSKKPKTENKSVAKYVPPFRAANDKGALLQKQVKRLVNKLSTSNLEQILSEFEQVYHENSRNGNNAS